VLPDPLRRADRPVDPVTHFMQERATLEEFGLRIADRYTNVIITDTPNVVVRKGGTLEFDRPHVPADPDRLRLSHRIPFTHPTPGGIPPGVVISYIYETTIC
jgi:hypothetical protein